MCFNCILYKLAGAGLDQRRAEMFKVFNGIDYAKGTPEAAAQQAEANNAQDGAMASEYLRGTNMALVRDIQAANAEIARLRADRDNLREVNAERMGTIRGLHVNIDGFRALADDLRAQRDTLEGYNKRLVSQLEYSADSYRKENDRLILLHNEMAAVNEQYRAEQVALRSEIVSLTTKLDAATDFAIHLAQSIEN